MTRLFLVRHGPTHVKTMIGWSDAPVDLGNTAQLARLAAHLPDAPVVSSDLSRAVATADAIAGARPRLAHEPDLRELNFGDWEGRGFGDVEAEDPDRLRAFYERPGDIAPPGGESWNALRHRVGKAVDQLLAPRPAALIVVAHFGPILTQLQRATGKSSYDTFAQKIDNLSVTELAAGARWQVALVNHLP